ncbi:pecanex-like protein 4 [Oculina patagonica]
MCLLCSLVEVLGFPGSSAVAAGPGHVHKVYTGDVPWSMYVDWLEKEAELKSLVLKAYRYAFKLTYDEAVLGEVTSEEELAKYMTEYDRDWYLGTETDHDWQLSIMHEKPFLFSLGRDKGKGTYTSRVLTKQEIMAPVGRLNGECVRDQWASLALELLYFTNNDEERYSIQAHPTLLRNLTIQAADPPLRYPVYSSGAVSVPLAVPPL